MGLENISKRAILTICVSTALLAAGAAIYYRSLSCLPFILGLLLGAAVSAGKVFLLKRTVDQSLNKEEKAASSYVRLQHLLRLAMTGAALLIAALVPAISLWGAAAGVLTYQLGIYLVKFTAKP